MRAFILLCVCIAAASAKMASIRKAKEPVADTYFVAFKDGYKAEDVIARMESRVRSVHTDMTILYKYKIVFNGIAVRIPAKNIEEFRNLDGIDYIEEDGVVRTQGVTWGLDRVDQRSINLDGRYSPRASGSGVNVYVLDTGILPTHYEFGNRARIQLDTVGDGREGLDCNGHGTHCAGTAAGENYGVARDANIYASRVLNCGGSGTFAGIVSAMDDIAENGRRPGVLSMSLGGGFSSTVNDAVGRVTSAGFSVSVAAGNSNADACNYSPASAPSALTVGATNKFDARASFSNFGTCVDIWAPGRDVTSSWYNWEGATNTISGTSMACPHVTGGVAVHLQTRRNDSPTQVLAGLQNTATQDAISDVKDGSPNLLLYVG